jgi:hypothetical protein
VVPVIPALNIAVSGMLDAANRLNGAAASTVRKTSAGASLFQDAATERGPEPAAETAGSTGRGSTSGLARNPGAPLYIPSFAEDAVAMRQAVSAYKANAKMLRTVADLAQSLVDTVNKR